MVVVLEEQGLAYFGIPKAAGTSIYLALYQATTGKTWAGPEMDIHRLYNTLPVTAENFAQCRPLWKFTVVRDPIRRILSAYQNRVQDLGDLHRSFGLTLMARLGAWRRGLSARPSADQFFERFDDYARYSHVVRQHTMPSSAFIGSDLGYFDQVYTMHQLDNLAAELSLRLGTEVRIPFGNASQTSLQFTALSGKAQARLRQLAAPDYDLLADYFRPPDQVVSR